MALGKDNFGLAGTNHFILYNIVPENSVYSMPGNYTGQFVQVSNFLQLTLNY